MTAIIAKVNFIIQTKKALLVRNVKRTPESPQAQFFPIRTSRPANEHYRHYYPLSPTIFAYY